MRDIFCLSTALSSEMPSLRRLFFTAAFFLSSAVAGSRGGAGTKETWLHLLQELKSLINNEITEIRILYKFLREMGST